MIISNRKELLSHGNIRGRRIALDIIDRAMQAIDARDLTTQCIRMRENMLTVADQEFDLDATDNIYILGAGKGVIQIAEALEEILGDRITEGVVIEKKMEGMARGIERLGQLKKIKVLQGGHPIPDETSVQGAKEIKSIAQRAGINDLVFFCVQGGCTSLTTLPVAGIGLNDIQTANEALLKSGIDVQSINTVRATITQLSRGRLAPIIHPARIINIIVNDFVRLPGENASITYDPGWGPTAPVTGTEPFTMDIAIATLQEGGLWYTIPDAVRKRIEQCDLSLTACTSDDFRNLGIRCHSVILADPSRGAKEAKKAATAIAGLNASVLSTTTTGEAKDVGAGFAEIAHTIADGKKLPTPPCAVISSGEMTVTITGRHGAGGRNQEAALSAALQIVGNRDIVIASVGTDGTDGPTAIAGGIVDGETCRRARERGIDPLHCLVEHDSSSILTALDDAIYFEEPGNNICDLSLIVVTD